jgi:hypothetical protein
MTTQESLQKWSDSRKKLYPELQDISVLFYVEMYFTLVVPIYLWGWLIGLLVHSALSSLLHIVLLLRHAQRTR